MASWHQKNGSSFYIGSLAFPASHKHKAAHSNQGTRQTAIWQADKYKWIVLDPWADTTAASE